jgi:hypothetical protein
VSGSADTIRLPLAALNRHQIGNWFKRKSIAKLRKHPEDFGQANPYDARVNDCISKFRNVSEPITIQQARAKYLADARSRQLAECTSYKYRLLFKQIESFANRKGLRLSKELKLETLDEFRCGWKDRPRSSQKTLERLRAFLHYWER